MNSRLEIQISFRHAIQKAEKLEGAAERLDRLAENEMETSINNLGYAWKGQGASDFFGKGYQMQSNMREASSEIRSVAFEIRAAANRIYQAEMQALRIAEDRTV